MPRLLDALPPAVCFKGPVLAQRLYGDIAAREYCDLDLLLRPADIPDAIATLQAMGFTAALSFEPWQLERHLRDGCEYAMSNGQIHLELHWQFAPRQFGARFDVDQLFRRSIKVASGDRDVSALSPEDEFLMLVVHGTKHGWSKLAWIADLAEMLRHCPLDWDYVGNQARRIGIQRMLRVTLRLTEWLGAAIETPVRASLAEKDGKSEALAQEVEGAFLKGIDLDSMLAARHRFILAAKDSASDRLVYLLRYLLTPGLDDWHFWRLPAGTRWLYPAVRLLRLATQGT